jgi:hypothetical protein
MSVMIFILTWVLMALITAALWHTLFLDDDDNFPEP